MKGKLGDQGNDRRGFGLGRSLVACLESWHKAGLCPNQEGKHKPFREPLQPARVQSHQSFESLMLCMLRSVTGSRLFADTAPCPPAGSRMLDSGVGIGRWQLET
ncbi:hypothetical protein EYF80_001820 [Liparis tanakae]|uniref:Uncharacterized protein n=1 Tax=Liparis tanakae TaxID=230148 RepID=A0A4Z2JCC5_9TELE|nr:hypothetical protein EYF80_001820 [Liparis tanakae]